MTVTPGDLCLLRPPSEFVVGGQVILWSLSELRHHTVSESEIALVVSVEPSRIPREDGLGRICMAEVLMVGMPFRIRVEWLTPSNDLSRDLYLILTD